MKHYLYTLSILLFLPIGELYAQNKNNNYIIGSFETNTNYYQNDTKTDAQAPKDKIGSNNYLKVDYHFNHFVTGVQLETYQPALIGYPLELKKTAVTNYYASWVDDRFSITVGSFYEQLGSGLLFRSWEDRALGLNNAILGARATYHYKDLIAVRAFLGSPRFGMSYSDTRVRGGDLTFSLSRLFNWNSVLLNIEGSILNTFYESEENEAPEIRKSINGYSARLHFDGYGFNFKTEFVDAGKRTFYKYPDYIDHRGNAQLIELGYNANGLGITLTGRRLEWMSREIIEGNSSTANLLNYTPGLCTQYTYALTNYHPYSAQSGTSGLNNGEMGAQLDLFYYFKRGSLFGGKRGLKLHANYSNFFTTVEHEVSKLGNLLYRDFSIDVDKQFTKKYKLLFLYSMQEINPSYGKGETTNMQHIFVSDMQYKFNATFTSRLELQYLYTKDNDKDWLGGLLETSFAPNWSIFVSDFYNHGDTKVHYYNAGFSYAKSKTRVSMSYGRNREGYVCSGGVCHSVPAYTGFNLGLTTSF